MRYLTFFELAKIYQQNLKKKIDFFKKRLVFEKYRTHEFFKSIQFSKRQQQNFFPKKFNTSGKL